MEVGFEGGIRTFKYTIFNHGVESEKLNEQFRSKWKFFWKELFWAVHVLFLEVKEVVFSFFLLLLNSEIFNAN